jgi:hypothetical protein
LQFFSEISAEVQADQGVEFDDFNKMFPTDHQEFRLLHCAIFRIIVQRNKQSQFTEGISREQPFDRLAGGLSALYPTGEKEIKAFQRAMVSDNNRSGRKNFCRGNGSHGPEFS